MSANAINTETQLLAFFSNPRKLIKLSIENWDLLIRVARHEGLLARLGVRLDELRAFEKLPSRVQDHLTAAMEIGADHERVICWEVNRIERALRCLNVPIVLLKGAAYVTSNLPLARGRLVSDVDILVPRAVLNDVEATLMVEGWKPQVLQEYDQLYYRKWMHELPPMRHATRQIDVDVHHTILPLTSRLKPDPALLFESAMSIGDSTLKVLAPIDMVLHSATHLFFDGDLDHALRDLVDMHDLLGHFGRSSDFWERLVPRAVELQLHRPLFYALRYCSMLLGTHIPTHVMKQGDVGAPCQIVLSLMDELVERVLVPENFDSRRIDAVVTRWLLYARSHYLRMPLYLLIPHLVRKFLRFRGEGNQN